MNSEKIKKQALHFLKDWWCSLLLLPFIYETIHQIYWALRFNIFFMITYDFSFPVNIIYFLLDNFLLIVHEAGHTFFSLLGVRFITILGGSLFQILLPMAILFYTWVNRQKIGIQLSLTLVGLSWLGVAGYAADGGQQQLPLIGGLSKESHDWRNLLMDMNMIEFDLQFGIAFAIIGFLFYAAALITPLWFREYNKAEIELDI
ncbi:hypothetical protein NC796_15650 [Aliifodinibius sp. S!AR15-10]|uniref:hypothetical protein n=1 Tax=Aliifodinibius sp. S!AR15-10 TaxID=2950437 RepID=UPI0028592061|nr:hypothetical protein [Aliifodinibius sp. S!AR15-10]MDR8392590.1 hypothetical protein [Aliifodinibius sp. S!AR15-10]